MAQGADEQRRAEAEVLQEGCQGRGIHHLHEEGHPGKKGENLH